MSSTKEHTPATILIVEDVATTRRLLRGLLDSAGYQVLEAADAATGLYLINELRPTLTLLDVHLPDMSGLDIARLIPEHPFAILTADQDEALFKEAKNLGALSYFIKPPQAKTFLRQLTIALKHRETQTNLRRALAETRLVAKAIGLLIGALEIEEDDALKKLQRHASLTQQRVTEIAQHLMVIAHQEIRQGRTPQAALQRALSRR